MTLRNVSWSAASMMSAGASRLDDLGQHCQRNRRDVVGRLDSLGALRCAQRDAGHPIAFAVDNFDTGPEPIWLPIVAIASAIRSEKRPKPNFGYMKLSIS